MPPNTLPLTIRGDTDLFTDGGSEEEDGVEDDANFGGEGTRFLPIS